MKIFYEKTNYRYMKNDVYINIMHIAHYIHCIKFFIDPRGHVAQWYIIQNIN